MSLLTRLLNWIRRLLKLSPSEISRVEDYIETIVKAIHYAREVYYEDILPLITVEVPWFEANGVLQKYIPDKKGVDIMMLDETYYIPKREFFEVIDKAGIQRFLQYRKDVFDCDDFALAFKTYASEVFLVNAVGFVIGKVIDREGHDSYHAWNIVIVDKGGKKVVYTIEPQSDQYAEGLFVEIGDWKYEPLQIIM